MDSSCPSSWIQRFYKQILSKFVQTCLDFFFKWTKDGLKVVQIPGSNDFTGKILSKFVQKILLKLVQTCLDSKDRLKVVQDPTILQVDFKQICLNLSTLV